MLFISERFGGVGWYHYDWRTPSTTHPPPPPTPIPLYTVQGMVTGQYYNILTLSVVRGARCSFVVKRFRSWCDGSPDRSFMVYPLSYFSFQPVLHDWCNKGRGMCHPVCGMVHIKEPLLLIEKE